MPEYWITRRLDFAKHHLACLRKLRSMRAHIPCYRLWITPRRDSPYIKALFKPLAPRDLRRLFPLIDVREECANIPLLLCRPYSKVDFINRYITRTQRLPNTKSENETSFHMTSNQCSSVISPRSIEEHSNIVAVIDPEFWI